MNTVNRDDARAVQYWNLRQTSQRVLELHIKGTIGSASDFLSLGRELAKIERAAI